MCSGDLSRTLAFNNSKWPTGTFYLVSTISHSAADIILNIITVTLKLHTGDKMSLQCTKYKSQLSKKKRRYQT